MISVPCPLCLCFRRGHQPFALVAKLLMIQVSFDKWLSHESGYWKSERFPTKRQRGLFIMVYLATSSLTWIITVLRMYGNSKEIDWCVYVKSIFLSKVPVAPNWLPGWILAFAIWRCVSDRSFQHFWAENEHFSYRWKWVMGLILCSWERCHIHFKLYVHFLPR